MKNTDLRIGNLIQRPDLGDGHLRTESILAIYERVKTTGPIPTIVDFKDIFTHPANHRMAREVWRYIPIQRFSLPNW